uniref:Uncharacterized protein n=1 Tax=Rhizophora mucronata TaxID=61149 RepID=A0A2P2IRS5_RHIMU
MGFGVRLGIIEFMLRSKPVDIILRLFFVSLLTVFFAAKSDGFSY